MSDPGVTDFGQVRAAADQKRQRGALAAKRRWTPREAAAAFIADIDSGEIDPEVVCMIYAVPMPDDTTRVGRYTGATSHHGSRETFWIIGMIQRALMDWLGGN